MLKLYYRSERIYIDKNELIKKIKKLDENIMRDKLDRREALNAEEEKIMRDSNKAKTLNMLKNKMFNFIEDNWDYLTNEQRKELLSVGVVKNCKSNVYYLNNIEIEYKATESFIRMIDKENHPYIYDVIITYAELDVLKDKQDKEHQIKVDYRGSVTSEGWLENQLDKSQNTEEEPVL